jgi:hypothetical protein
MVFSLKLPVQSVPITTKVVSSNTIQDEVYSIHYVIKFVRDWSQVGGFLQFPPPLKWPPRYNWNIVESGVKHHEPNQTQWSRKSISPSFTQSFHVHISVFLLIKTFVLILEWSDKKCYQFRKVRYGTLDGQLNPL